MSCVGHEMRSENMREMEELAGRDQEAADACDMKTEGGSPFKVKSPAKGGPQKMGKQLDSGGEGQSRTKHDTYI